MFNKKYCSRFQNPVQSYLISALIVLLLPISGCKSNQTPAPSFSKNVYPIFKQRCAECHLKGGKGFEASGFSVESYDTIMKGTRLGPVIQAGQSISSTLVILIENKADPSIAMPHGKEPLTPVQVQTIKDWINAGAKND